MGTGIFSFPPSVTAMPIWTKPPWALTGSKTRLSPALSTSSPMRGEHRIAWGLDPTARQCATSAALSGTGVLAMRSHIDVDTQHGLSLLEGALAAREEYKDLFHLQLVAFPQSGLGAAPAPMS